MTKDSLSETAALRARIGRVVSLGAALDAANGLRDGSIACDDVDALMRLITLHARWYTLRDEEGANASRDPIFSLDVNQLNCRPISDNAGGIVEMGSEPQEVRRNC